MEINDRLFSETSDEVLYSILMDESEYALYSEFREEMFSKKHKHHQNDVDLDEADSYRGIGRATAVGALSGPIGAMAANYGRVKGYEKAREADRNGESEVSVKHTALMEGAEHGGKSGAAAGAAVAGLGAGSLAGVAAHKLYKANKVKDDHKILRFLNKEAKAKNSKMKKALGASAALVGGAYALSGAAAGGLTGAAGGALGAEKKTSASLEHRHAVEDSARKGRYRD